MRFTPAAALFLLAAQGALAAAPVRYVPAPPGRFYYMLNGAGYGYGTYTSSETALLPAHPGGGEHPVTSKWTSTTGEIGLSAGYGLGKVWFIPSVDVSAYQPAFVRTFGLTNYLVSDDPEKERAQYAQATLHSPITDPETGSGLGDLTVSSLAMIYGDNASGTWISLGLRAALATGTSAHKRFIEMLHGEVTSPANGDGTTRLVPGISVLKVIGGQRTYLDIEYSLPLSSREHFSFVSPTTAAPAGTWATTTSPFADSNTAFDEVIKPGGVVLGTIGMETSIDLLGVNPGFEVNVRSFQAAKWTENGKDVLLPLESTSPLPTHTPGFLTTAAWVVGSLPLKSVTEVEVALLGTARFKTGSNAVKFGVSYLSSTFGSSLGFRVAFVNLFTERALADRAVPGKFEAREINVSPMIEAPLAPSTLIRTGVSFPRYSTGISQEEAGWVAGQLRSGMGKLRDYDVMSEKDMEQIASEPCGDAECGVRYGRALKLQAYVVSRLEKAGAGFALGVQMINLADGTVAASDSVSAASLEELRGKIPLVLQRLTSPAASPAAK